MLSPQWGQEYQTSPRKQGPGMRAFANTWCLTVVESGTSVDVHLLAADIMNRGIYLAGGGALIDGLDTLITKETGMPVKIADNPLDCVVMGAGNVVENLDVLKQVLVSRRMK